MAYLRKEKETIEIDYPLEIVWPAIVKALDSLEWKIEEANDEKYNIKARTKASFFSYASVFFISVAAVNRKTSRVTVTAETPVTTITAIVDFGRTQSRIELFFKALAQQIATTDNVT